MASPSVKLIYANTPSGAIGRNNTLLAHVPEDLAVFKEKTLGAVVMMGRKTYDSLPPSMRPLPNRTNVVLSTNRDLKIKGAQVIHDPIDFIFRTSKPVWIIGGAQLYTQVQQLCDEVHHTEIYLDEPGDTHFHMDTAGWDLVSDSGVLRSRTGIEYRTRVWTIPMVLSRY